MFPPFAILGLTRVPEAFERVSLADRQFGRTNEDGSTRRHGLGVLLLLLVASAVTDHGVRPPVDQHANSTPQARYPDEVVVDPGSHLYHAGTSCPYVHRDAKQLSKTEALLRGLVPCPYCVGNSSARLTPRLQLPP